MKDILYNYVEKESRERAIWINETISNSLPKWKCNLLKKYPNKYLAKLLFVNIEFEKINLNIGNFGESIIIRLNGKCIGKRNYKV